MSEPTMSDPMHTQPLQPTAASQRVEVIPVLSDNYTFLLWSADTLEAAVVDPGEAEPVVAAIEDKGLRLTHILCTHHHWDHVAGVEALAARWPHLRVVASRVDAPRVEGVTDVIDPGDAVTVCGLRGVTLDVSCHTRGHIAFLFGDALFCGDSLFLAGCGRFFEGDAADMLRALRRVAALPDETRLYCGHEYSLANLAFACAVAPRNADAAAKLAWATQQRALGLPTIPSTLGEERAYNPFLRWDQPEIQAATAAQAPVEVLAQVRAMRSAFKPPSAP
jgi:hydroxyacylglutathione hydrolase